MARKQYPYNAMTTKKFREMGRYYEKVEYLNPFHIIKERGDLRVFRDAVLKFCNAAAASDSFEQVKDWINILLIRATTTQNNTYFAGEKKDLFGFADYICIDPIIGVVLVQGTSASGRAEHRRKILRNIYAQRWINFHPIELWTWRKSPEKRGSKRLIWKETIEPITMEMFTDYAKGNSGQNICSS